MKKMDVVYPVKFGNYNPELKYSLRTLQNMPMVRNVYIGGFVPDWTQNVIGVPVKQTAGEKFLNQSRILQTVCLQEELSDDFILFNDDFFAIYPVYEIPKYERGFLSDFIENATDKIYRQGAVEAYGVIKMIGIQEPLNYDVHAPMVVNKNILYPLLNALGVGHSHWRSMYGNTEFDPRDSVQILDVKIHGNNSWSEDLPFVSTSDDSFQTGAVGKYIRKQFTEKSPYET